jgi:hypothetical protein
MKARLFTWYMSQSWLLFEWVVLRRDTSETGISQDAHNIRS